MVALAACGGGGGGGGNPAPQNPPQGNRSPTVTLGADVTAQVNAPITVQPVSAADPDGNTLTFSWTSNPPDNVTFSSASTQQTQVTFGVPGTYTLTLTANDGTGTANATGSDSLTVTVSGGGGGANAAPTANAGADQTITLPTTTVSLSGSATDDGLPSNTLTYQWSGPAGVTFSAASAAQTDVTLPAAGAFTLTLSVSDGELSDTDDVVVTVQTTGGGQVFWPAPDTSDALAPDYGWTRVAPADVGMDAAGLQAASDYASAAGGAGMVIKGGRLVHSWATGTQQNNTPVSIDTRFQSQSATKSIGGIALGLALYSDTINLELDTLAQQVLPTFGTPPANDPTLLDDITIRQLATHTSGFEKIGTHGVLRYTPGSTWSYSDGALNWLGDLLTVAFNEDISFTLGRVWARLGLNLDAEPSQGDDITWRAADRDGDDVEGDTVNGILTRELSSGIAINANAMARVGLLFLRNGQWSDGPVLSPDFVTLVRTPQVTGVPVAADQQAEFPGAPDNYGVLWWTNAGGQLANVPTDAYWAWGQYDSLIVVIPSLDLVIARIGPAGANAPNERRFGEADWSADYEVLRPFLEPIVCADAATTTC